MERNRHDDIQKRVEHTMEQLGKERYQPNPFLHTRIKAQLAQEPVPPSFSLRWALQPTLVGCLLLLNSLVVWNYWQQQNTDFSMAEEYGWTEASAEDYLLLPDLGLEE